MFGYTTYFILKTFIGSQRAARIRSYLRKEWTGKVNKDMLCLCVAIGIFAGATLHGLTTDYNGSDLVNQAEAATTTEVVGREVRIEVAINWTEERIEKEIRDTFPEDADRAVAIVMGEGGLVTERQSQIVKDGIQEPSFCAFQIHKPSWDIKAKRLGYGDYKTNVQHCVKMARYIYDSAGGKWTDWSAYNNGSYKKYMVY